MCSLLVGVIVEGDGHKMFKGDWLLPGKIDGGEPIFEGLVEPGPAAA